jgi:hypothetical protein
MSAISKVLSAVVQTIFIVLIAPLILMWMVLYWLPREAFRWIRKRVSLALSDIEYLPKTIITIVSVIILLTAFAIVFAVLLIASIALNVLNSIMNWLFESITHVLLLIILLVGASGASWAFERFRNRLGASRKRAK